MEIYHTCVIMSFLIIVIVNCRSRPTFATVPLDQTGPTLGRSASEVSQPAEYQYDFPVSQCLLYIFNSIYLLHLCWIIS